MKRVVCAVLAALLLLLPLTALAHNGRTDSNGGHHDRSTGEYHYHHGYPAHQHENGVCPYGGYEKPNSSSRNTSKPVYSTPQKFYSYGGSTPNPVYTAPQKVYQNVSNTRPPITPAPTYRLNTQAPTERPISTQKPTPTSTPKTIVKDKDDNKPIPRPLIVCTVIFFLIACIAFSIYNSTKDDYESDIKKAKDENEAAKEELNRLM